MALECAVRESGGVTIVDLKGRATIGDDNDLLSSKLREVVGKGARNLLLNLVDLTQVDSSGIGSIAAAYASCKRQGGTLKLLRPRGRVRQALDTMHWFDYIQTFEDEVQAVKSYAAGA